MGHHDAFIPHRRSRLSLAAMALVWATLGTRAAIAQSVTGVGDVNPGPLPVPSPHWVEAGEIYVGDTGIGSLTIEDGATASSNQPARAVCAAAAMRSSVAACSSQNSDQPM